MTPEDSRHMARAIQLARKGLYTTHPNPRVGCVLAGPEGVVGEGYHRRAGEPHAERIALTMAGARARGATAYVTLEPCCHQGRTGPCTQALIEAGVARVLVAMRDPNPLVAGKGMQLLRQAGISVEQGAMEQAAVDLNPGFISRMERGRPWVRCKLAMSLDGRTAMASGESKWITGPAARLDVQLLRARSDAIVTGIGTVLADDPSMNVRLDVDQLPGVESAAYRLQPLRIVLDPRLEMPAHAGMIRLPGKTLVVASGDPRKRRTELEQAGAEVALLPGDEGRIDLGILLEHLADRQINEVLIEAGPTLAGAALGAGLIDELVLYAAPHIMGDGARGLFRLPGLARMEQRKALEIVDLRIVGRDIRITARPEH